MVVQLSSVDPLKIRELKAAAGKYAYSSRIKWLHIDSDKTQVGHFESIREELRYYNRQLDCVIESSLSSELRKLQHENISHYFTYLLQEQELRLIQQSCPAVGNHRESACNRCVQSFDRSL